MRRRNDGAAFGVHLSCHQALRAWSEADQHKLPGTQFGKAEPPQRFHMHENIGRAVTAREEAEPAQPVEPLYLARSSPLVAATVTCVRAGGICAGCSAVDSSIERIRKACRPRRVRSLDDNARALIGDLKAVATQARHMQKNVRQAIVRNDKSITFGYIEPFNDSGELDDARRLVGDVIDRFRSGPILRPAPWISIPLDVMTPYAADSLYRLFRAVRQLFPE